MSSRSFLLVNIIRLFLNFLHDDEYQILINQKALLKPYLTLSECVYREPWIQQSKVTKCLYAKALYKAGNILRRQGTKDSKNNAVAYHQKSLEIRLDCLPQQSLDIGHSYISLGAAYNEIGGKENNLYAVEYYKKGLSIFEYHGSSALFYKASALNNIANAYRDLDNVNIPVALEYQKQALELFANFQSNTQNQKEQGKLFYNLGVNYHLIGKKDNFEQSIIYFHKACHIFKILCDDARLAIALSYMGEVYKDMGKDYLNLARNCLTEALYIQRKIYESDEHPEVLKTNARLETVCALINGC